MSALVTPAAEVGPRSGEVQDSELVRRVRRGDDTAFEALYHRYHRRITAYIHGMVHDHGRAEDVAQDVFVSALRRMRETERPIAFKPWVYEIAKNACIDQFRRSRRAEEVSYDAEEGLGAADYGRLVSSEAMPEDELESKTNLDHLRGAFGGLSEMHHEILVMRELEGLSYREIGERLGMTRPSVESTLFRARRRLTEEYDELVSGARCQRIQAIIATAAATDLGARDQRRLARHVSHCQPCRRQARLAGLDVPVTAEHPVRTRIAAMLPLPLFLRRRWLGLGDDDMSSAVSSHASSFAQWSAQFGSTVDPSWFKAAATAATIAVAGVGAASATHTVSSNSPAGGFSSVMSALTGGSSSSSGSSSQSASSSGGVGTAPAGTAASGAPASDVADTAAGGASTASGDSTRSSADGGSGASGQAASGAGAVSGGVQQAAGGVNELAQNTQQAASGATTPPSSGSSSSGTGSTGTPSASMPSVSAPSAPSAPAASVSAPNAPTAPSAPSAPSAPAPPSDTSAPAPPPTPDTSGVPDPGSLGGSISTGG